MFHMFSDETANPHSESLIPNYVNQTFNTQCWFQWQDVKETVALMYKNVCIFSKPKIFYWN